MPPGLAFICVACKRSPGILKINRTIAPLSCLQMHRSSLVSTHAAACMLGDGAGRVSTIAMLSERGRAAAPAGARAVMILHGSLSAPSLWTSQAASENHSLMMHLRKPVVRGMVYCIGVLTSERTHCYAGCFIKSLKGTSLIVPEISTFHVAGAACCSAPGNGTNSLSGSKQSGF